MRFKKHISGKNNNGFSLQGTHRNQGWVGQDSRSRSLTGHSFRGLVPRGHGGKYGNYPINYNNKGRCNINDSTIVKSTTVNTAARINRLVNPTTVYNTRCNVNGCTNSHVVDTNTEYKKSQGFRVTTMAKKHMYWAMKNNTGDSSGQDNCSPICWGA